MSCFGGEGSRRAVGDGGGSVWALSGSVVFLCVFVGVLMISSSSSSSETV